MPTRNASAVWEGGLQQGNGRFDGESGAIGGSYNFGSRFGEAGGTNPEELLAAAEAACFSMALAGGLEKAGHSPTRVETKAACTVEKVEGGFGITTMKLNVRAVVPGIDDAKFQEIAAGTKVGCPVSKALAGVDIQMEAILESAS
ncbi:MAG TPA: OsmC family peroxiredoxin [Longimicrobium sp.]|nr:OsmC family peroxiredoxin [Longimicrobium sp.]